MDNLRNISVKTGTQGKPDQAADSEPPVRLGHYLLDCELGRGFSSIVYQALDLRRQRTVALKVLTLPQTLNEQRRTDLTQRFEREAQAISTLTHPNIVAIYEVGETTDGRRFIAMERLGGETLRHRLQRTGCLPVLEAVAVAIRVAEALHYAHSRGIIHRDVKPDNIFLAAVDGSSSVVPKLMDFGIARVLADQGLTQDGTVVGSPAYMSPEQINGKALDPRTDVFSLAVMLTEMLTAMKPFEANTIPAVMQQILHRPPDLRNVPDGKLQRALAKALSKNSSGRYPDAASFASALRQAVPLDNLTASDATQFLPRNASGTPPSKRPFLSPPSLGLGGLALITLAMLPLFGSRPAPPEVPAVPHRLKSGAGAQRHQISAAWHSAPPRTSHPIPIIQRVSASRATPGPPASRARSAHAPRRLATATPARPAAPAAPAPPAAPAAPQVPIQPTLFALRATIKVAASREEMRPPARPAFSAPTVKTMTPALRRRVTPLLPRKTPR